MADPEIEAMMAVSTALVDLQEDAQGRVLRWAAERYAIALPTGGGGQAKLRGGAVPGSDEEAVSDEEIVAEAPVFAHCAELFAKARPKTDADKALVAAYWLQAMQGQDKWQAAQLQKELKNLGHAVGNITDALNSNMRKKPQRVIQLQKAGTARQARKTYKVTHEGLVYVTGMLGTESA